MTDTPTKKVQISQFQIKNAKDVSLNTVLPVKIAPPPVTVKRSKSLKTDRSSLKRYISVPNSKQDGERNCFTLPRHSAVFKKIVKQGTDEKAEEKTDSNKTESKEDCKARSVAEVTECSLKDDNAARKIPERSEHNMPEPATWQAVVNTHRRGSSMTFVTTQNWAHFDTVTAKKEEKKETFNWDITVESWDSYEASFHGIGPLHGFISGKQAKEFLSKTGISREALTAIWTLADMDHDGSLSLVEFAVAMHCVSAAQAGLMLPGIVPRPLRDALLFHVNRNDVLSQNKGEDIKSPEKSSLKSIGSTSKGANVTFLVDSETLSRSRPRPSRKLQTTTPLHLRAQPVHSSSSYYSSDNSDGESDTVVRKLDMSDSGEKKKADKKKSGEKKEKKAKKEKSSSSDNKQEPASLENGTEPEKKLRREHTYEEVGDFMKKLEVDENDEDIEALLQSSDDDSAPLPPPPKMAPPKKQPSRPDMGPPRRQPSTAPPMGPPPGAPPSPPPEEEEGSSSEGGHTSSSNKEASHDPAGYELLAEDRAGTVEGVTILLDGGELIESDGEANPPPPPVEEVQDTVSSLPILRIERPARQSRSSSVDTAMMNLCAENNSPSFKIPAFKSLSGAVCHLSEYDASSKKKVLAGMEELRVEKEDTKWDLSDAEETTPDMDKLEETDLNDLRTMIRDYEIHNNALINLTRELRIELLKVQEQKLHLRSTLKCMKSPGI